MQKPNAKIRPMWEIKQAAEADAVDLYIYGDVESDYYDWWTDELVEGNSAEKFRKALEEHADAKQINIYINSYGGSVFEGTAIYNQLRRHSAHKTVYVDGFACSIASVIAMAGDEIVMPRNTMMMIHNMWMCACGNAAELRKAADDLDTINAAGRLAYLAKAGDKLDESKLKKLMDAETWLTAEQCIEMGLADRYADADADLTQATAMLQKVNAGMEQHLAVNKSIAAQLRALAEENRDGPSGTPTPTSEPEPEADPEADPETTTEEPPQESTRGSLKRLLAGAF